MICASFIMEQTKHDNIKHEDAPLQTKEEQQDVPKRIGKRNGAVQLEFFDVGDIR